MRTSPTISDPIEIFISYSHKDESFLQTLLAQLSGLIRAEIITVWHGESIPAGEKWKKEIDKHLNTAQLVLLLVSENFIASDYCYDVEFKRAMERSERGEVRVIAIILAPSPWRDTPLAELKVLPKGGKPITEWVDSQKVWESVTEEIRQAVKSLQLANQKKKDDSTDVPKASVTATDTRAQIVEDPVGVSGFKYTRALIITLAVIVIVAGFIYYKPQPLNADAEVPQASPSTTPLPASTAEPPRGSVSLQPLKITITEFPPYDPIGGPNSTGHIAGTVEGSGREAYSIVIYSYTNLWYVQPSTEEPRTPIDPNGSWRAEIKTGTKYAVLLAPRDFQPPDKTSTNPTRLEGVVMFMEVEGKYVIRTRQNRNAVTTSTKNNNTSP